MMRTHSIRFKLFLVFFAIAVFSTATAGYLSYRLAYQNIRTHIMRELQVYNQAKALHLEDLLASARNRAADFSSDGFVRDSAYALQRGVSPIIVDALNKHLKENKLALDPTLIGIMVLNKSGAVIASTGETEIGSGEAEDDYFLLAKDIPYGAAYVGDVALLDKYHFGFTDPAFTVSAPLVHKTTEERLGVIVNFLSIESLNRVLDTTAAYSGSEDIIKDEGSLEAFLVNTKGYIITNSKYVNNAPLRVLVNVKNPEQCSLESSGTTYINYRGVEVVGTVECLKNGWKLVSEIAVSDAFSGLTELRNEVLGYAAFTLALVFLFSYLFSLAVTRPLQELAAGAQAIGKGDFSRRIPFRSSDEIGLLASAFNNAAGQLQALYGTMEDKIREKTHSFEEKMNELERSKTASMNLLEDIQYEKKESQKLAADLEKFKLAVDNASDHVVITDVDGTVLYANRAVTLVTGYSAKEVIGHKPNLWGGQMNKGFYEMLWRTIKTDKKPFHGEIVNKKKWGEIYTADVYIAPILDAGNNVLFFIGIERDITKAKEIDRAKSELVSIASHQLRTPLTSTNWYTELLRENYGDKMTKPQKELVDEIYKSNKRMVRLVNALLNVSRIDMGTLERHPTSVPVCEVVEAVTSDLKAEWTKKKITVKRICKDKDLTVFMDRALLLNIFQNVLENAIKYSPVGSSITIADEKKDEWVLFSVKDEGCGIPEAQKEKIFTKMFRADNARKIDPDGNGLGLYLVRAIVEQSGGTVWFESEENKGTTFIFALPTTKELAETKATKGVFSHHD
jgi:PAS domain S-box-containing protein